MPVKTNLLDSKERAEFYKIFAHPVRLEILDILRNGEQCVCHLEAHLGFRQAYISQQLMVLKNSGIIEETRQGRNIFYKLTNENALKVIASLESNAGKGTGRKPLPANQCPCPKCNPTKIKSEKEINHD